MTAESEHLSLLDLFSECFQHFKGETLSSSSTLHAKCLELEYFIRAAGIFSSNETSEDLQPSHIKYILGDFFIAEVNENINEDRLEHLRAAEEFYMRFIRRSLQYELLEEKHGLDLKSLKKHFFSYDCEDLEFEDSFANWLTNIPRDVKIGRMRTILSLKPSLNELSENEFIKKDQEEEDVDSLFNGDIWIKIINYCALLALDRLGLILREIELISTSASGDLNKKDDIKPSTTGDSPVTKISKPFKLVKNREQIAADTFKYGHNLPTMTVDEYLQLEMKRGNIISGGGAASAVKQEVDEDDQMYLEEELKKQRDSDELKDMYKRGSGNTYNRS